MKKTYIVTGAGKGTGRVFAKTVAQLGGDLALISRTTPDLKSLENELLAINPEIKISIHCADLSDQEKTKKLLMSSVTFMANQFELLCVSQVAG